MLLVGESTAGKTRAAFEAMRLLLPDYSFLAPSTREAVEVLLEDWGAIGDCVVWLDDLERFLGPGGLTLSALHRLLAPHPRVVVLSTMRSHEYNRYRDRAEHDVTGVEQDVWRQGRSVLRQAQVVQLERRWTVPERARARVLVADPRLSRALAGGERFGVAEMLAAGPELAQAWQHAWVPGHHPRGAALVAAAVDARRAGYHRPLPADVLQRLHDGYLARHGGPELRPESFHEALVWALAPTVPAGANSLLLGDAAQGYIAFDYLIDLPAQEPILEALWWEVLERAPVHEAYAIACNAWLAGSFEPAYPTFRRAAQAGIGQAEGILFELGMPLRPAEEALVSAQRRLNALRRELGDDHEDCLMAESEVATFTAHCGRYEESLHLSNELAHKAASVFGSEHRLVLGVKFGAAWSTFASGAQHEGLVMLDAAVRESTRVLGPRDMAVLDRRWWIVQLLVDAGHVGEAKRRIRALESDCAFLATNHPITVRVRRLVGVLRHSSLDL
ncbi:hypothetical protein [Streptomyces mirabilis]|uniref:hypothetical protein n=1 Tax=Streptomyces mirabilis TaxID=68239 RepID=UPI00371AE8B0